MSALRSNWHPSRTLVFLYNFPLQKQENLHTHFYFPPLIKLLYTLLRSFFFSFALEQISERELVRVSLIFTATSSGHTHHVTIQYHVIQ